MSSLSFLTIVFFLLLSIRRIVCLEEPFIRRLVARHEFCSKDIITENDLKSFESCSSKFNLHEAISIQCLQSLVDSPLTRESLLCQRAAVSVQWNDKFINCSIEERKRVCHQPSAESQPNEVTAPDGKESADQPVERIDCDILRMHKYTESNECLEKAFNINIEQEFYDWFKESTNQVGVTRIRYCDINAKFTSKSLKEALRCTKYHGIIEKRYVEECSDAFWSSIKNSDQLSMNQRRLLLCNGIKVSNSYETYILMCALRKMKWDATEKVMEKLSVSATHRVWKTAVGNKAHPIDEYRHRMQLLLNRRNCLESTLKERKAKDPTLISDSDDE